MQKITVKTGDWYRTCQECGHKQKAQEPNHHKELTDSYRNSKCKRCKSEALDYGKWRLEDPIPSESI